MSSSKTYFQVEANRLSHRLDWLLVTVLQFMEGLTDRQAADYEPETPEAIRLARAIKVLRQVWVQQYKVDTTGAEVQVLLRASNELPPATQRILSPYDLDARYARHNDQEWVGYRTHLTE